MVDYKSRAIEANGPRVRALRAEHDAGAETDGRQARKLGKSLKDNPWTPDTPNKWASWRQGWVLESERLGGAQ